MVPQSHGPTNLDGPLVNERLCPAPPVQAEGHVGLVLILSAAAALEGVALAARGAQGQGRLDAGVLGACVQGGKNAT